MKNKKIWIAIAMIALVATVAFAQAAAKVTIDYRLNTKAADEAKNYFNWTADKLAVKDKYDAKATRDHDGTPQTGASVGSSTEQFNAVRYDKDNKKTMPVTLRGLFLFAVDTWAQFQNDNVEVITNADKSLTIRYFHRGTAYYIKTDAKGIIDVEKDCKMLSGAGDNVAGAFLVKADYLKAGGDNKVWSAADWIKIEPKLVADVADSPTVKYAGKLTAKLDAAGVLTIKGTLTLKK